MLNSLVRKSSAGREIPTIDLFRGSDFGAKPFEYEEMPWLLEPKLVSGTDGMIESVLLVFPQALLEAKQFHGALISLLRSLNKVNSFLICTNLTNKSCSLQVLQELLPSCGIDLECLTFIDLGALTTTPFAQDICIAASAGPQPSNLLEPSRFVRLGDAEICDIIQDNTKHLARTQPLEFQGGNCLVAGDKVLLGFDHWHLTKDLNAEIGLATTDQDVRAQFSNYLDASRELVVLGGEEVELPGVHFIRKRTEHLTFYEAHYLPTAIVGRFQPIFHIDMFLTPLGKYGKRHRFAVADPTPSQGDEGINLLGELPFAKIVSQLEGNGFEVVRNPITTAAGPRKRDYKVNALRTSDTDDFKYIGEQASSSGISDDTIVSLYPHYVQTWNNALIERDTVAGRIIMPTYNSPLDAINRTIFEGQNLSVEALADFSSFAKLRGAAHCLVRDLRRAASFS